MFVLRVAVNYPLKNNGLLYYSNNLIERGQVVEVPLGKRKALGCVLGEEKNDSEELLKTPKDKIKNVAEILPEYKLSQEELVLYEWMASYYHYSFGQLIFDCLPGHLKRPRELEITKGEGNVFPHQPNSFQKEIIRKVVFGQFKKYLIHGVTGSGKTLIYLEIIRKMIAEKKSVLFLLPEINLTPQFTETFSKYLNCQILAYHSELNDSQKYQIFKLARTTQEPILVLGVRSSVFVPLQNLGLIIIDEEHDSSFKQDDRCPYNARDVASKKAQILKIPILMGSATPSLETYSQFHQAENRENLFELRDRAGDAFLPGVSIVDVRENQKLDSTIDHWPVAKESIESISQSLEKKEQVLVFVNRLGFANFVQCRSCGHQFECPNCSITLRYYRKKHQLVCHHCEYKEPFPEQCPACACMTLTQKGFGTEKVESVLKQLFPDKIVERFDRDEIKNFKQLEQRLDDFHDGKIDIMVGTQMLSKGHNFERVKLVLILGVDGQLNFPDFRASEKVYQTLTQVAGRSGRFSQDGKVLVQTLNPENELFEIVKSHSFDGFYKQELGIRKLCDCPPFKRLVMMHFSSKFQDRLIEHVSDYVGPLIQDLISKHFKQVTILGPRPAAIEKKQNQFTWSLLLKSSELSQLHNLLKTFEVNYTSTSSISYKIDVDPYNMM